LHPIKDIIARLDFSVVSPAYAAFIKVWEHRKNPLIDPTRFERIHKHFPSAALKFPPVKLVVLQLRKGKEKRAV
jgi:hypothetical protein